MQIVVAGVDGLAAEMTAEFERLVRAGPLT